MATGHYGLQ